MLLLFVVESFPELANPPAHLANHGRQLDRRSEVSMKRNLHSFATCLYPIEVRYRAFELVADAFEKVMLSCAHDLPRIRNQADDERHEGGDADGYPERYWVNHVSPPYRSTARRSLL